ncbi:uncharacterized protein LOC108917321 isoform X1 [Anoplophora glabripennis]|uniref:uncharacterized protein LOC108917321 isoform X1 n=1 Tax=Anoplophora glabripennis TaxID=217634 RepID=UPI0008741163|nr:uncharacterized protein LOC108917321 isoform X1 [Anoplophora glabripennis]
MPVHFRRYFQMVEKRSSDVNPMWKVLHALLFILIVVMSFVAAVTFNDIFESFSYTCILYAKPTIRLDNIQYHPAIVQDMENKTDISTSTTDESLRDDDETTTVTEYTTVALTTTQAVVKTTTKVTPTEVPSYEIINNEYWIVNSTLKAKIMVDFAYTVFGSKSVCNTVLFFPLATLVLGTFSAIIVMICGRGGKGYSSELFPQQWIYVYPFLVFSLLMIIINAIVVSFFYNGMEQLCAEFETYTGSSSCTKKINYLTDEAGFGLFNLYQSYHLCLTSLSTELIMWTLQALLMIFRVLCIADFDLIMVNVSSKRRHSLGYDVDEALMKSHKLKKVTFEDNDCKSRNKNEDVTQV